MGALQRFAAIVLADLRERTRSPRFWALLALMALVSWLCFPPAGSSYVILCLNAGERGYYSSAWVGMVLAMANSILLGLGGFYLVRGTVARDIDTRVWQLLVATPMTRGGYLLAKWASHLCVLSLIVLIGMAVGLLAQWIRAEDRQIDLWELAKPLLLLTGPGLAVTAAFAIWFDLVPWLRRTTGNVLFFVVWIALTSFSMAQFANHKPEEIAAGWRSDPNGLVMAARDFQAVRSEQLGHQAVFGFSIGSSGGRNHGQRFEWKSWSPRPAPMAGRLLWVGLAMLGVLASSRLLDWSAARPTGAGKRRNGSGARLRWLDRVLDPFARGPTATLAVAELKLSLRQRRAWWWLAWLLSVGWQVFGQGQLFAAGMLLAWVLPLDILARAILREQEHRTGALVFSAPGIERRLLLARLGAGFALLLAMTLPGLLRLLATEPSALLAAVAVCLSLASWGLCFGVLWRNPRPFELGLVAAAYVALQGASIFDLERSPIATAGYHALFLLPAWLLLAWGWPRLARR